MLISFKVASHGIVGRVLIRSGSPFYQLHFFDSHNRKRQRISLGTRDQATAKARAKHILHTTGSAGIATLKRHARRDNSPRIGQIIDHYLTVTQCATAKRNANCLLRVVAGALKLKNRMMSREMNVSVLDDKLVGMFIRHSKNAPYTNRTDLAGARATFSRMSDWHDFKLPDLSAFLKATSKTGVKVPIEPFRHIQESVLAVMDQSSKLAGGPIRRAFVLSRYLGLTPKEIAAMHKGWIERRGEETVLCVRQRAEEGFTLKTGGVRERDIELAPWIADEVASADSYMVPGNTPYMRSKWMMRNFCGWCGPFIPDRKGRAYELRKQAGSDWLTKTGSWAETQYLLGHASPTTTAKWYASFGKVPKSSAVWASA